MKEKSEFVKHTRVFGVTGIMVGVDSIGRMDSKYLALGLHKAASSDFLLSSLQ